MTTQLKGKLILKDQAVLEGESFGAALSSAGEVVFNTGMVGYPEALTDPSYYGQILVLTYPLIGNYGVPPALFWESGRIQVKGLIVQNYIKNTSHFQSQSSLGSWLKKEGIPALQGIDTRFLTTKLRSHGVMLGRMEIKESVADYDPNTENILTCVSCQKTEVYGNGRKHIIVIDCGVKQNIIRSLVNREVRVSRVSFNDNPKNWKNYDGVLISNGPGDPQKAVEVIESIKYLLSENVPILGICLGNQLLALASGMVTYKLKFGHRSQNQPVLNCLSKKALITSQNHGFAIDTTTLNPGWVEWFTNLNDGSNEGIRHKTKPFLGVQFHPEAAPGPTDADFLLDEFLSYV